MKRNLLCYILIAVFSTSLFTSAYGAVGNCESFASYDLTALQQGDSDEGQRLFAAASDYVFSARKLSVTITTADNKGKSYSNRGFFVAVPDRGYMKIDGVSEFQFTPTLVSSYNVQTNEIVFQPRKTTAGTLSDNPFSILSKSDKGITVSDVKKENLKGISCTKFSVFPKGKAYYTQADIYVTGKDSSLKVLRIVIVLKNSQTFSVDITSAGAPEPSKVQDYQIMVSDHPDAQIVDLRN